ncbi:polysaccharide pyruvyl transferase family protein [Mesonia aquimarina]|uniref:polysaccharide pyruvyl transferase family protein n=1 Tax=Mesonia aquimarina TaxID=1504967 RepID=UPI0013CE88F1|nr:polysaccharide pyruvyl transferase family protein [Mesonia aquimarina]
MLKKGSIDILVKGAYGAKNFGDDALQFFLTEWFKKNHYKVAFITKKSKYLKKMFPNTRLISQDQAFNVDAKTLILGGGTQFFAFNKISFKEKLAFYIKHLSFKKLLFTFQKRVLKQKMRANKSIGLGLGLGPFQENTPQLTAASNSIAALDEVFTRDRLSFEFAKSLNSKALKFTDICFLPGIIDFSKFKQPKTKIKKVGIIVRDWNLSSEGKQYYKKLQQEVERLKSLGYLPTYILFKPESYWQEYLENQQEKYIVWNPEKMKIVDFLKELMEFDLMISARFHGIIFASLLGIPSISIGIEQKLKVVGEFFPNSLQVWPYPFSEDLIEKVNDVQKNYAQVQKSLQQETNNNQILAQNMFNELKKVIQNN